MSNKYIVKKMDEIRVKKNQGRDTSKKWMEDIRVCEIDENIEVQEVEERWLTPSVCYIIL